MDKAKVTAIALKLPPPDELLKGKSKGGDPPEPDQDDEGEGYAEGEADAMGRFAEASKAGDQKAMAAAFRDMLDICRPSGE